MTITFTLTLYLLGIYYFLGVFLKIQRTLYRGYRSDESILWTSVSRAIFWPFWVIPLALDLVLNWISSSKLVDKINEHYNIK